MTVAPGFRDRRDVEVEILEALVDRAEEGMTVFELRSHVGADIDEIETALSALKRDGLIDVEQGPRSDASALIKPADRVIPAAEDQQRQSTYERLRDRLPF